ncbi:AraC family transcriptional regulator [Phytoactinopolyspora alkaliphila]|uniref:AraC family transcriptional regulator n=1 Tax=Phytoactinopolyspora alkaliphila TaxID=1783498 RepID=A0A6N9YFI8_9ACTN|nr:AraC family transcriptional regulator [Phytoactinopolyspora alkaliphila]NED93753.1 AraC family transcriptional regulator [Phytoactinopolyspora alkaliphila]
MTTGRGLGVGLVPRLGPAVADYPPGSTFGPREAKSFQFVWILRGRASWWHDGAAEPVQLEPGRLLLVRPGMRDSFRWDTDGPTRHAYVHFTLGDVVQPAQHQDPVLGPRALVSDPGAQALGSPEHWPLTHPIDERDGPIAALCRYLLWLGDARPDGWKERARDVLALLVVTFVAGPLPGDDDPPFPRPLDAMVRHVAGRWRDGVARPVPLTELATAASISPSSLSRLFRREFGVGPVAALELIRLARAEPLLWMSNLTMAAIAAQCGFTDAYHFSRRFRAAYGVPPSVFRADGAGSSRLAPVGQTRLRPLERRLRTVNARTS